MNIARGGSAWRGRARRGRARHGEASTLSRSSMTYKIPPNLSALRQARIDAEPVLVTKGIQAVNRKRSAAKTQGRHRAINLLKRLGL